jgi:hypothetical protein
MRALISFVAHLPRPLPDNEAPQISDPTPELTGIRLTAPEIRLLLLAARPNWTAAQQDMGAGLVGQVSQWPVFVDTAMRKFVVPMVYENLAGLKTSAVPDAVLQHMRDLSMRVRAEMLLRQSAFLWFHRDCVLPSGVDYAYLKGPALAARFYANPLQRYFQDIDILVPARLRLALLRRARDLGAEIFDHVSPDTQTPYLRDDAALHDFLSVTPTPELVFPQGLLVELHAQIDYGTALFDTHALLHGAQEAQVQRERIRILKDDAHIAFVALHHTKHFWSKLHWLADLDAICRDAEVDLGKAKALARGLGIESTLSASLELQALAAAGHLPEDEASRSPGKDLLRACIEGLHGDMDLEVVMRQKGWRWSMLGFDWQEDPVPVWRRGMLKLRSYRPYFADLRRIPGGRRLHPLRYALAVALRAVASLPRKVRRWTAA